MANSFNIPERTLNQLGDATNSINVIGGADGRISVYEPLVCRATDHADDKGTNCTTEELLNSDAAIFVSARHGEPWKKDTALTHLVHQAATTPAVPDTVSVLFPNFDYTTFE